MPYSAGDVLRRIAKDASQAEAPGAPTRPPGNADIASGIHGWVQYTHLGTETRWAVPPSLRFAPFSKKPPNSMNSGHQRYYAPYGYVLGNGNSVTLLREPLRVHRIPAMSGHARNRPLPLVLKARFPNFRTNPKVPKSKTVLVKNRGAGHQTDGP